MFKNLLFFFFTLASFSETLTVTNKTIETGKSITIESKNNIFKTRTLYTHKGLVECLPEMDAVYKVISSKKLEIIPRQPWESSTDYQCHLDIRFIHTDTKSMYDFSFTMPQFGLRDYYYFDKEKLLRVEFNDKVDMKTLKENVKLYKLNKLARTELQYAISTQDARVILFKINEAVGSSLELQMLSGLKSASGKRLGAEVTKQIHKERRAEVILDKKSKAMTLSDAPRMVVKEDGNFAIRIFFDDTFYGNPVKKFIRVEGLDSFRLKKDV